MAKQLVYLHQYFRTPDEGGAIRSYHISQALQQEGYEVCVISGADVKHREDLILPTGVRLIRLPVRYSQKMSFWRRILSFVLFVRLCWKELRCLPKVDLLYASSTPLTVGFLALQFGRKFNIPFVFEIRDLWPEVPDQLGLIKSFWFKKVAYTLAKKVYEKSEKIIVLSPLNVQVLSQYGYADKLVFAPNFSDSSYFQPQESKNQKVKLVYAGALGFANDVDLLVELAKLIDSEFPEIELHVYGVGSEEDKLKKLRLSSLFYHGETTKQELKEEVSCCDVAIVSFKNHPALDQNSPNKFFDALAMGLPVMHTQNAWIRELTEQYDIGYWICRENLQTVLTVIKHDYQQGELQEKGKRARHLAETKFEKNAVIAPILEAVKTSF